MKDSLRHIRQILTWGLLGIFLFPSVWQFEHLFESHKHEICEDVTIHFHEKQLDCNIYDFHFSSFDFQLFAPTFLEITYTNHRVIEGYVLPEHQPIPSGISLRGPPMIS